MFETDNEEAFLDIASNTLAVIIIVTVFSLSAVTENALTVRDPAAVIDPLVPVRVGMREPFAPISRFVVFGSGKAFEFDHEAISAGIDAKLPGFPTKVSVEQGVFDFLPLAVAGGDLNYYSFNFRISQDYLNGLKAVTSADMRDMLGRFEEDWGANRVAPTFLVYGSGIEAFSALHANLLESQMPWRWVHLEEGVPVRIQRTRGGFKSLTTYW
jgi:hypothetical protein